MEILGLFSSAVVLFVVIAVAAIVWVVLWQLLTISRGARAGRRGARRARAGREFDDSLRRRLLTEGFSASEARDAVRQSRTTPGPGDPLA